MSKIVIPIVAGCEHISDNRDYYLTIAPIDTLPFDKLPLDTNLRQPKKKAKIITKMLATLKDSPQDFLSLNSGIVLIAKNAEIKYEDDTSYLPTSITVEMIDDIHGVANGGHTLEAIRQAFNKELDLSKAEVAIRIHVNIENEVINKSVVGLNDYEKVDKRSLLNKNGVFDQLKVYIEKLGYTEINYYQNQAEHESRREHSRQDIFHILRLLMLIDREQYDPIQHKHPIGIATSTNSLGSQKRIQRAEDLILNFLDTLLEIEELIYKYVETSPKNLPGVKPLKETEPFDILTNGKPIIYRVPANFTYPIIAAFRAFINDNDKWKMPIDDLLEDVVSHLYKDYAQLLRKEKSYKNKQFLLIIRNKELWHKMYNSALNYYTNYIEQKNNAKRLENGDLNNKKSNLLLR